jgi:hypothetical protein
MKITVFWDAAPCNAELNDVVEPRFREVPVSNLGSETAILTESFCSFPQSLHKNVEMVP